MTLSDRSKPHKTGLCDPLHSTLSEVSQYSGVKFSYYDLGALEQAGLCDVARLPFSIRVLLENALRNAHIGPASEDDVRLVASWTPEQTPATEFPYMPGRVTLQDFTGVPVVVDLAAMRDAVADKGGDPGVINPVVHSDLVIDHSVQVDYFASEGALARNIDLEFERNVERYKLLKWSQTAFDNMLVIPPGTGDRSSSELGVLGLCSSHYGS